MRDPENFSFNEDLPAQEINIGGKIYRPGDAANALYKGKLENDWMIVGITENRVELQKIVNGKLETLNTAKEIFISQQEVGKEPSIKKTIKNKDNRDFVKI